MGVSAGTLVLLVGCGPDPVAVRAPVTVTVMVTATTPVPTTLYVTTTVGATASSDTPTTSGLGFGRNVFNHTKVETGVTTILTSRPPAGYGQTGVTSVSCPADVPVVAGTTFNCTATIGGVTKTILITIKDSDGKYEVGVPN